MKTYFYILSYCPCRWDDWPEW